MEEKRHATVFLKFQMSQFVVRHETV
uniref:Uncharacterized protein n=1 Tax=Anguilla anguilla TaxID=7936 RepID=A0A0E9Y047_ANGAN